MVGTACLVASGRGLIFFSPECVHGYPVTAWTSPAGFFSMDFVLSVNAASAVGASVMRHSNDLWYESAAAAEDFVLRRGMSARMKSE